MFFLPRLALVVEYHWYPHGRPLEEPAGLWNRQIDAPMAHRVPEVVVPIGTMDSVATVEVHDVRYIRKVVSRSVHILRNKLKIDVEGAHRAGMLNRASGD